MKTAPTLIHILLIALGGGLGSTLRYLLSINLQQHHPSAFPWSTLTVNLIGCAAIGVLAAGLEKIGAWQEPLRLLLITGLLGGFTTFSAFGLDVWQLIRAELWHYALAYVSASVVFGILLVIITYRLTLLWV